MSQKPIQTFREKSIEAAVWANLGDNEQLFHTVTISRNYKDEKDQWKRSYTYLPEHLDQILNVTQQANQFLADLLNRQSPEQEKDQPKNGTASTAGEPTVQPDQEALALADASGETPGFVERITGSRGSRRSR